MIPTLKVIVLAIGMAISTIAVAEEKNGWDGDVRVVVTAVEFLDSYINVCIPKEDPQPMDKIATVAIFAEQVAHVDILAPSFKLEVAKRDEVMKNFMRKVGTRAYCADMADRVESNDKMMKDVIHQLAEEAK